VSVVVGIDLGGTKVAAALLRERMLGQPHIEHTELTGAEVLIDQLARVVVAAAGGETVQAVGVGVPSVVEFATGRVVSSVNIPLQDVPLREVLGQRLGVPVFVDNDATVAALAEAHDERLDLVAHDLVMLTIGTGVGGGIVLGGRIFRGATGGAGEIGHTLVALAANDEVPPAAEFPQVASLESHASGRALDRQAERLGLRHGGEVVEAARRGDPAAAAALRRWARMIGVGIANAINTFDPEEVVIGGGAAAAAELLLEPATEIAQQYVVPGLRGHARIRLARFHATAGVIGAALLAVHELERGGRTPPDRDANDRVQPLR
jgi:glucokinase